MIKTSIQHSLNHQVQVGSNFLLTHSVLPVSSLTSFIFDALHSLLCSLYLVFSCAYEMNLLCEVLPLFEKLTLFICHLLPVSLRAWRHARQFFFVPSRKSFVFFRKILKLNFIRWLWVRFKNAPKSILAKCYSHCWLAMSFFSINIHRCLYWLS